MKRCVPLEKAAEAVCDQSAVPPLIFQLPPEQGRKALEKLQDVPVYQYPIHTAQGCNGSGVNTPPAIQTENKSPPPLCGPASAA